MTWHGYSDGSASTNPYAGGWSFVVTPDSPTDEWDPHRIVCRGSGGSSGMKLGEAEITPLMYGVRFLATVAGAANSPFRDDRVTAVSWMVDSEFVAMIWAGSYKAKQYKNLWASIADGAASLRRFGIEFDVIHRMRNLCPGQVWVDQNAGLNRRKAMADGPFADLTWRDIRP